MTQLLCERQCAHAEQPNSCHTGLFLAVDAVHSILEGQTLGAFDRKLNATALLLQAKTCLLDGSCRFHVSPFKACAGRHLELLCCYQCTWSDSMLHEDGILVWLLISKRSAARSTNPMELGLCIRAHDASSAFTTFPSTHCFLQMWL